MVRWWSSRFGRNNINLRGALIHRRQKKVHQVHHPRQFHWVELVRIIGQVGSGGFFCGGLKLLPLVLRLALNYSTGNISLAENAYSGLFPRSIFEGTPIIILRRSSLIDFRTVKAVVKARLLSICYEYHPLHLLLALESRCFLSLLYLDRPVYLLLHQDSD